MDDRRRRLLTLFGTTSIAGLAGCAGMGDDRTDDTNPFQHETTLSGNEYKAGDGFGRSVAISADGSTAIIGAGGSAYVFEHSESGWHKQTKLAANNGNNHASFGFSLAISANGATVIIGAPREEDPNSESSGGSAYVFEATESGWSQQTKLTGDDTGRRSSGWSVAMSGDGTTAIVGGPPGSVGPDGADPGAAFVFEQSASGWHQRTKLTVDDVEMADEFGDEISLSADGQTALIGAWADDNSSGEDAGSVYAFERTDGGWTLLSKLTADDGGAGDWFGASIALANDGRTAIISAPDDKHRDGGGSVYVFTDSESGWSQRSQLVANDGLPDGDKFGSSIAVSTDGTTGIIGAPLDFQPNGKLSGSAFVYTKKAKTWRQQTKLFAPDGDERDFFGSAVSVSGNGSTAIIGSRGGAVHMYSTTE